MDLKSLIVPFIVVLLVCVINMILFWNLYSQKLESINSLNRENNILKENINNLKEKNNDLQNKIFTYQISNFWEVDLTAYTSSIEETNSQPDKTAIMEKPRPGYSIAVSQDLKFLLGKRVYIYGFGVRYVNDLMNKRYKKRIDILVNNKKIAKEIGIVNNVKLILIEPELLIEETTKEKISVVFHFG